MIFYECRHCGETGHTWLDEDNIGAYERLTCERCGKDNYVKMSRIGDNSPLTYEEISAMPGFSKMESLQ